MLLITNDQGVIFNVRFVRQGERYGREDCLVHDKPDPLVEFYDATNRERFGPRGQFVSRYYLSMLRERPRDRGLALDGGVSRWSIDTATMAAVYAWLDEIEISDAVCAEVIAEETAEKRKGVDASLATILQAYESGGRTAANEAFEREIKQHRLKAWEAAALAERFRNAIKG